MIQKISMHVVVALAGLALIVASFGVAMPAQAQSVNAACAIARNIARHLTMNSTGADVTALQNWLIAKGYSIPAGATGYFGPQTRAAVAAYQAANGIAPAAGYFGPLSLAKLKGQCDVVVTPPNDDDDEDEDEDNDNDDDEEMSEEEEAEEAIEDARDRLDNARDEVEEANDDGEDTDDVEEDLEEAEELLDEADQAFDDEDYDEVMDLIDEVDDLIESILDDVDADEDDDVSNDNNVETSAEVQDRNGADNDIATFEIEFTLNAFNQDAFIDQDTSVSINYEIQDSEGNDVGGATSMSAVLQSSAPEEGDYFLIEEDEEETFTLTVSFDPLSSDEGEFYRLQLESIEFNDSEAAPDQTWTARPESRFRTGYVNIAD